ncbi:MAG: hypothetical protein U1F35_10045 [Steroidobacteraceae bacterium]
MKPTQFKFGTTLYALTNEFLSRRYSFEQLIEQTAKRNIGPGLEIVGFQSIRGFPGGHGRVRRPVQVQRSNSSCGRPRSASMPTRRSVAAIPCPRTRWWPITNRKCAQPPSWVSPSHGISTAQDPMSSGGWCRWPRNLA